MDLFPLIYPLAVIVAVLLMVAVERGIEAKNREDERAIARAAPDMPAAYHGEERT